jgi:hypothetical protein
MSPDVMFAQAMAMPVSFYEKKAREVHAAMADIVDNNMPFLEVARKYHYKPEALAVAFAVFGTQSVQIANTQNIVSSLLDSTQKTMLTVAF